MIIFHALDAVSVVKAICHNSMFSVPGSLIGQIMFTHYNHAVARTYAIVI